LPPAVINIELQAARRHTEIANLNDEPAKYLGLSDLQARNETWVYKVVMSDPATYMPLVYTPTVGEACQKFAHIFRQARGMYLPISARGRIREILGNWGNGLLPQSDQGAHRAQGGRDMEQPISQSPGSSLPWLIRGRIRITGAIVAVAVAYLLTSGLPDELNLLIPYDVGVAVYIALFGVLMERASPEDAARISRRGEPNNRLVLIVVNALAIASLVGVAAMLNRPTGRVGTSIST
jgi:hypothetical protein